MSVFLPLPQTSIALGVPSIVTQGVFSNNTGSLLTFWTSSTALDSQKAYYYGVFQTASALSYSEVQFAVAYGHRLGSGSYGGGGDINDSPTKAIYSQFKQITGEAGDTSIKYGPDSAEVSTDQIYAINFNRARYKQRLDVGNIQINLAHLNGDAVANAVHTGSNVTLNGSNEIMSIIDDSADSNETGNKGRNYYNLVSGSTTAGIYNSGSPTYVGRLFPSLGLAILDANLLDTSASFNSMTSSVSNISVVKGGDNAFKLFTSLSGSAAISANFPLTARQAQARTSTNYFIRVGSTECNYSNNPTYVSGSDNQIVQATFVGDPKTYITTVGLYDETQTLLAVAKLSQPLQKSFNREALVKVRLNY
jgi:hypothetical protein